MAVVPEIGILLLIFHVTVEKITFTNKFVMTNDYNISIMNTMHKKKTLTSTRYNYNNISMY